MKKKILNYILIMGLYFLPGPVSADGISNLQGLTGKIGQEDINYGNGQDTDTFSVPTWDGGNITLTKVPSPNAEDESIIKKVWYVAQISGDHGNASLTGSLAWIKAQLDGDDGDIVLPGNYTYSLTTNLEITENMKLIFQKGAVLGGTANLSGDGLKHIVAGNYQIFSTTGTITFPADSLLRSSWFSNFATAITKIGSVVVILKVTEADTLSSAVTTNKNTTLDWEGPGNIITLGNYNLALNGDMDDGNFQRFNQNGSGVVTFGKVYCVKPEYWGPNTIPGTTEMTDEIESASIAMETRTGGIVEFNAEVYLCINVDLKSSVTYRGAIPKFKPSHALGILVNEKTTLKASDTGDILTTTAAAIYDVCVENISLVGLGAGTAVDGIVLTNCSNSLFKNLGFENISDHAIHLVAGSDNHFEDIFIQRCMLDTTQSAKKGAIHNSLYALNNIYLNCKVISYQASLSDANAYICGWTFMTSATDNSLINCYAEGFDQGFYIASKNNQLVNCKSVLNWTHGVMVASGAEKNQLTNCRAYRNSQETDNTYSGFYFAAGTNGNVSFNCVSESSTGDAWQQKYGFYDGITTATDSNVFYGCIGENNQTGLYYTASTIGSSFMPTIQKAYYFTDGDTTPSVGGQYGQQTNFFSFENYTGPATITDFDDGTAGQMIFLYTHNTGYITIANNANISNVHGQNFKAYPNVLYCYRNYGGVWYQLGDRMANESASAAGAGTDGTISSRSANPLGECDGFISFRNKDGSGYVYVPYWENISP